MTFCLRRCFPFLVSTLWTFTILRRGGRECLIFNIFLCFGAAAAETCSIIFAETSGLVIALPDVILLKVLRSFLAFNPSDFIRTSSLVRSAKQS